MSSVLAGVMLEESLGGRRVLEIGCGLALPSLVAKALGADITASDYHPLVESFLMKNTALNNLSRIPYILGDWTMCDQSPSNFDLIIGSDLLYESHHAGLVSNFIHNHIAKDGEAILLDPGRGVHSGFVKEMGRLGFKCMWKDLSELPFGHDLKGHIFRFRRVRSPGNSQS